MTERIRVVVVDDHPLMREGLRALMTSVDDIDVVGEASSGANVVDVVRTHGAHVVVMDLHMPGTNGGDATRMLADALPKVGVLVLTMLEDDQSVFAAMRAGAMGYLLKGSHQDEILRAVRSVAAGQAVFGPGVARRLIDFFASAPSPLPAKDRAFPDLTLRENEVLALIATGRNNNAIAAELCISVKTLSNHISSIFAKLQVADRAEAIVRARGHGLGG